MTPENSRATVEAVLNSLKPTTTLARHLRDALAHADNGNKAGVQNAARAFAACSNHHYDEDRNMWFASVSKALSNLANSL